MNYSGILVLASAGHVEDCLAALDAVDGVEVHQVDADTGRIVVVQEAATIEAEIDGMRRIQSLPHVVRADLVYHRFEECTAGAAASDSIPIEESQP